MKRPLVRFTPEAARLVSKFHPETRKLMRSAIEELRRNPFRGDELHEELTGFSSYKPGRYRILSKFDEDRKVIDVLLRRPSKRRLRPVPLLPGEASGGVAAVKADEIRELFSIVCSALPSNLILSPVY